MLRSNKSRVLLAAGGTCVIAASVFLVSTSAQKSHRDLPRPDETALAQLTAIIEYYGGNTPEPPFSGELNGFTFRRDAYSSFHDCNQVGSPGSPAGPFGFGTDHGSASLVSSGLDFNPTYIPAGLKPVEAAPMSSNESGPVAAARCGDEVVQVSQKWVSSSASLAIERRLGPAVLPGNRYSGDRLEATSIDGRAAIVVKPRFEGELVEIFMRDEHSFWTVWGEGLALDEVRRVAEGIK